MARVLSALVLLPLVIGTVWYLPPAATLALAAAAALLAFFEYAAIVEALDTRLPRLIVAVAVVAGCIAVGGAYLSAELILMSAVIAAGALAVARGAPGPGVLRDAAAAILPIAYIGLPLGAIAAVHGFAGREAVLLLLVTIVISDSAQFYCGRAFGRRPLAPAISPKKTVEGAIGGLVFGTLAMTIGGRWVFPDAPAVLLVLVSACITALGMVGDLFESMLKRSAGVKDSSHIIPGHGGVLDRIDSWLFAAPLYYAFVRYLRL
ncbi:MAG TPA: phosphatidate cytidylyltransferase [Vicinamibacterales bacterium]|nr:phosphatidate cytidylyltransferase [Vicinamibacterales bacterium]